MRGSSSGDEETVWCSLVPKKINILAWRVKLGRIQTRSVLDGMEIDLDTVLCPRCGLTVETVDHAIVSCVEVRSLWSRIGVWWNKDLSGVDTVAQLLQSDAEEIRESNGNTLWVAVKWSFIYLVWNHRNNLVFNKEEKRITDVFFEWQRKVFEWLSKRSKANHLDWGTWLSGMARSITAGQSRGARSNLRRSQEAEAVVL